MSIATKRGDTGQTSLAGAVRVSKAHLRVDAYGTVDEMNSAMGFARSITDDPEIKDLAKSIQRELFAAGSALATAPGGNKPPPVIAAEMVEALTGHVHRIEATDGILADWSVPGEHPAAAAFDVARTICRRAERHVVRLAESGDEVNPLWCAAMASAARPCLRPRCTPRCAPFRIAGSPRALNASFRCGPKPGQALTSRK